MTRTPRTMTDAAPAVTRAADTDTAVGGTTPMAAPALRLLGATGAVCVDGTCSFEPTVGTDPL